MNRIIFLGLGCCAALSASAGAGYLAVVGPAPLRFEKRLRPVQLAVALLPAIEMREAEPPTPPTNAPPAVVTPPEPPPAAPTNTLILPPMNAPVVTVIQPTNAPVPVLIQTLPPPTGPLLGPLVDPNDPNSLITAQMLIHYFRPQGTNAAGANMLGPLFIPPRPATPPSSTVRYTTP